MFYIATGAKGVHRLAKCAEMQLVFLLSFVLVPRKIYDRGRAGKFLQTTSVAHMDTPFFATDARLDCTTRCIKNNVNLFSSWRAKTMCFLAS
jgi:hypothetical protein